MQEAIIAARERGMRRQLISLATGLGKTVVIATLPELLKLRPNDVTLIIAHRDELISQLDEKMRAQNPDAIVGIEKADSRASEQCSIVIATVQTLTGARLGEFISRFGRRIALFIIDEAHHAAAPTYRAILDVILGKRADALVLGFTATPGRGDGVNLIGLFDEIVYQMDARAAIDAGYLVPVRAFAVATETSLDEVAVRGGDFVLGALAKAVDNDERNARILESYQTHVPGMQALIFTASVEHARNVAKLFFDAGIKAAFASGDTPRTEREAIVADFRAERLDVLVNCGLYLEGFDVPSIEAIINARPTKSATLYTQVTGRGLRPRDEYAFLLSNLPSAEARRQIIAQSPKPYGIVIDIVDQARRHQLITLPFLWGIPAQIDAGGRPISQVAERYEELHRRAPREAARVRTAEQIENALIELDIASNGVEVAPTWRQVGVDHWRYTCPPRRTARDRRGRPVPHFSEQYDNLIAMARNIAPRENAEEFALRTLKVERRSIREETIELDALARGDEFVATRTTGNGVVKDIAIVPKLFDAIAAANKSLSEAESNAPTRERKKTFHSNGRKRFRPRPKSLEPASI